MFREITVFIGLADGTVRQHTMTPGVYYVGRDPGCQIVIEGAGVSRRHVKLKLEGNALTVADLQSTSGTLVNGVPLESERSFLYPQTIQLGDAWLKVEQGDLFSVQIRKIPEEPQPPCEDEYESLLSVVIHHADVLKPLPTPPPQPKPAAAETNTAPAPTLSERRQQFLAELSEILIEEPDVKKVCPPVLRRVVELVPGAVRGALLILDPPSGKLALRAAIPEDNPPVNRTQIQDAAHHQQGFIWRNDNSTDISASNDGTAHKGIHVPLVDKGDTLGVMVVDNLALNGNFNGADLDFLLLVAGHLAFVVAQRLA